MTRSSPHDGAESALEPLNGAERLYRVLLRVYPEEFRAEYWREMALLFRDTYREHAGAETSFWLSIIWDVVRSAPALRMAAWRASWNQDNQPLEGTMKGAAMLTVVLGLYGAAGAVAEAIAADRVAGAAGATFGGTHLIAVVLGAIAGALLLVAGLALLVRSPSQRLVATIAAAGSLVLVLCARVLFPWMSIFSQLVGFVLPIALLAMLHWPRRSGPSAPGIA
jgi:hypothetical protein